MTYYVYSYGLIWIIMLCNYNVFPLDAEHGMMIPV